MDNKRIQECFEAVNEVHSADRAELIIMFERIRPNINAMLDTIKEMCRTDEAFFNCMFMMNFKPEKKVEIVSKHLGVNQLGLKSAGGKTQDMWAFLAQTMTLEAVVKLYDVMSPLYRMSLKEVAFAWSGLMRRGDLLEMITCRKVNPDDLIPEAAAFVKKVTEKKDKKFNIDDILNRLANGGNHHEEEDEEDDGGFGFEG